VDGGLGYKRANGGLGLAGEQGPCPTVGRRPRRVDGGLDGQADGDLDWAGGRQTWLGERTTASAELVNRGLDGRADDDLNRRMATSTREQTVGSTGSADDHGAAHFYLRMREGMYFCFASLLPCKKHHAFASAVGHGFAMHSNARACIFANAYKLV
jgi:hypothetical protein